MSERKPSSHRGTKGYYSPSVVASSQLPQPAPSLSVPIARRRRLAAKFVRREQPRTRVGTDGSISD